MKTKEITNYLSFVYDRKINIVKMIIVNAKVMSVFSFKQVIVVILIKS